MSSIVQVNNIGKLYRLGQYNSGSLSQDLRRWWTMARGNEDPLLQIGESNDRTVESSSNVVWSLRDINFELNQGEAVGIIGRNGAGKSTLLKILSRVTSPTTGSVKLKGRVASLLEVGTGFHPELSGRENIFLNGAILGMTKREVKSNFDEIVDFAGIERYLDTPVKRYSSGMYVRLAFAVAAHLEAEIMIVDEVLAVGDAEFQRKCMTKMQDVTGNGRTILFVSHNMGAIRNLCSRVVVIDKGESTFQGNTDEGILNYLGSAGGNKAGVWSPNTLENIGNIFCKISKLSLRDFDNNETDTIDISKPLDVLIEYEILEDGYKAMFSVILFDQFGTCLFGTLNNLEPTYFNSPLKKGSYISTCTIPANLLNEGDYSISVVGMSTSKTDSFTIEHPLKFHAADDGILKKGYDGDYGGFFRPKIDWVTKKIN